MNNKARGLSITQTGASSTHHFYSCVGLVILQHIPHVKWATVSMFVHINMRLDCFFLCVKKREKRVCVCLCAGVVPEQEDQMEEKARGGDGHGQEKAGLGDGETEGELGQRGRRRRLQQTAGSELGR